MERSRNIAVVAHCLLNSNARVTGIARYPGVHPVIGMLAEKGYGIIQLPCPEFDSGGLARAPAGVEEYEQPEYIEHCEAIVTDVVRQIDEYRREGYAVGPVIGMEGSPSCAVASTSCGKPGEHRRAERPGVFMGQLEARLSDYDIHFVGIDHHEEDDGIDRVLEVLT